MHLIQILLPVYDNDRQPIDRTRYGQVERELREAFGGVTAYVRAPAVGSWKRDEDEVNYDQIVIFEVMTGQVDRAWWARYRQDLETRFRQEQVVVRDLQMRLL